MRTNNIAWRQTTPIIERYARDDGVNAFVLRVLWYSIMFGNPYRTLPDPHELWTPDMIRSAAVYQFGEHASADIRLSVH